MAAPIAAFHRHGGVVYGTCAGLITVARGTVEGTPPTLGLLDIVARRNAFGRQIASAEVALDVPALGAEPFPAIFIRAPWVERAGPGVEVIASVDGHGVFVRENNVMGTSFHPELTGDDRVHRYFLSLTA